MAKNVSQKCSSKFLKIGTQFTNRHINMILKYETKMLKNEGASTNLTKIGKNQKFVTHSFKPKTQNIVPF